MNSEAVAAKPSNWIVPVLLIGTFMSVLDFFIVNVAIPSIQRDLHATAASIEWVVAGYALAFGCGLITGGRLGDHYGKRRVFMVGLALFTLASVLCGMAPNGDSLVAARIVQGASAALFSPQVLAIFSSTLSSERRARAIRAYGLTLGIAAVFGQLVGGALIQANIAGLGWRGCFFINVPLGILALLLIPRVVGEIRPPTHGKLDIPGVALLSLGLLAFMFPLIESSGRGWPVWSWLLLAASLFLLGVFLTWEHRVARNNGSPVLNAAFFKERAFTVGLLTQLCFWAGIASFFLVFALYMQQGQGLNALQAGVMFVAIGGGYLATSLLVRRVAERLDRQAIAAGGIIMIAGLGVLWTVLTRANLPLGWLLPGLVLEGAGMGIALSSLIAIVLARVMPEHAGTTSGVLATTQQAGNALGVAVIGAIFYRTLEVSRGDYNHAFQQSVLALITVSAAVIVLTQLLPRKRGEL